MGLSPLNTSINITGEDFLTNVSEAQLLYSNKLFVNLTYQPTKIGKSGGNLTIVSNDPEMPEFAISLEGEGYSGRDFASG